MECASKSSRHNCVQGHQPCPTPWICGQHLRRADLPLMDVAGPADPEEETPREQAQARLLPSWLLWIGVVLAAGLLAWAMAR